MSISHARKIRGKAARALESVNGGTLRDTITDVPMALQNVPVYKVLMACPGIGPDTCKDVLERAKVWPFIPLGDLTTVERNTIIECLGKKAR